MLAAQLIRSLIDKWREAFDSRLRLMRGYRARMQSATSYAEWREFASQLAKLEQLSGQGAKREWQYDPKLLAQKVAHLRKVRESGNVKEMMFALRTDLIRNVANVAKRWGEGRGRQAHGQAHGLGTWAASGAKLSAATPAACAAMQPLCPPGRLGATPAPTGHAVQGLQSLLPPPRRRCSREHCTVPPPTPHPARACAFATAATCTRPTRRCLLTSRSTSGRSGSS